MVILLAEINSLDLPTIYGVIAGTVGSICGVIALYRTISRDHIKFRVESNVGISEAADGPYFKVTIYNDGREIIVDTIIATLYGMCTDEVNQIMSDSMMQSQRWRAKQSISNVFPVSISRHDRFEYPDQPYPWDKLSRANRAWCVGIELASGQKFEIPSWRLAHQGPVKVSSRMFKPHGKLKVRLGKEAFETETLHKRFRKNNMTT